MQIKSIRRLLRRHTSPVKLPVARRQNGCLWIDYEAVGYLLLGVLEGQKIGPLRQGSEVDGLILVQSGAQQGLSRECADNKRRFFAFISSIYRVWEAGLG